MADPPSPPSNALAADWITIWQSEWAAVAVDREMEEAWLRLAAAQAGAVPSPPAAPFPQAPGDAASGPARPAPPTRASAAADAPDARDAAVSGLLDRAELERRAARAADPAGR